MTHPLDEPLFPPPFQPIIKVKRRAETSTERPRWSKYAPKNPVKCDDCMLILALSRGEAPASKFAHWKRKRGADYLLLCYGHAAVRREEDGMKPLEGNA